MALMLPNNRYNHDPINDELDFYLWVDSKDIQTDKGPIIRSISDW
jgi:hypothetical protein